MKATRLESSRVPLVVHSAQFENHCTSVCERISQYSVCRIPCVGIVRILTFYKIVTVASHHNLSSVCDVVHQNGFEKILVKGKVYVRFSSPDCPSSRLSTCVAVFCCQQVKQVVSR